MEPGSTAETVPPDDEQERGGEAACALSRVCEGCGALEDGPPTPVCGRCGTSRAG